MPSARSCLSEWFFLAGMPGPQALVWRGQKKSADDGQHQAPTDLNKTFQMFLRGVPYQGRKDGLLKDANGRTRTLYSLRHTYATTALLHGLTELEVARNMGTSVAYIEKHYSHVKNTQRAAQLSSIALPGPDWVAMKGAMRKMVEEDRRLQMAQLEDDINHFCADAG